MNCLQLQTWFLSWVVPLITFPLLSLAVRDQSGKKSTAFLSPTFAMTPGSVVSRYYHNIEFPKGHIGLKSFNAEVVDSSGIPVPLQETYLHHWFVARYYQRKGVAETEGNSLTDPSSIHQLHKSDSIFVSNSGMCQNSVLGHYFGLGSETRKTATDVPNAYAIEVGNPDEMPEGYEEKWLLKVHAIDTRGVADKLGCTECSCNLYNVTLDEYGRPLKPDYAGGLHCCYDQTQCKLKPGFITASRKLHLRYTVKWMDWSNKLLPVKIYIFDITDGSWKEESERHGCKIEYGVEACGDDVNVCVDSKKTSFVMPRGGHVVYGVAHQHSGGVGSTLYGGDGRMICSSIPTYGKGNEPGNEAGYIVGMSTCYPRPGSVKISDGETVILVSNYSSTRKHSGVMGLFYILVADQLPSHGKHLVKSTNFQFPGFGILVVLGGLLLLLQFEGLMWLALLRDLPL